LLIVVFSTAEIPYETQQHIKEKAAEIESASEDIIEATRDIPYASKHSQGFIDSLKEAGRTVSNMIKQDTRKSY